MFDPNAGPMFRSVLDPLGNRYGLTFSEEVLDPGTSNEACAFGFLRIGCSLLYTYVEPQDFPSLSKRGSRRGAKWMTRGFSSPAAQRAVVMLAQSYGVYMSEVMHRAGEEESAQAHLSLVELIDDHYPATEADKALIEEARREFRVFETHEVPEDVVDGVEAPTGYHLALMDPEHAGGGRPDDDPRLVEAQELQAHDYFRATVGLGAIRQVIGDERYGKLEDNLIHPARTVDYQAVAQSRGHSYTWSSLAEEWRTVADRTLTG